MVAGFQAALNNIARHRQQIRGFLHATCFAGQLDPARQLAVLVGLGSNVGQDRAAEIAGVESITSTSGDGSWVTRAERAAARWRVRETAPPAWPFHILGARSLAVWVAPFDGLPAHLSRLWEDATWLHGDHWQQQAPPRPAGAMPCVVQIAGHWRLWMPALTWTDRIRRWFR